MIDLNAIATRIQRAKVMVSDVETTGLNWRDDESIGYVLTFSPKPEDSFYLPINHTGGGNLNYDNVIDMLRAEISARPDLRHVGFNLAFDFKFWHKDVLPLPRIVEDASINQFLVWEHMPSYSLDAACRWMGVQTKKGDALYSHMANKFGGNPDRKQMANFHKLAGDDPVAVDYAAGDGTSTWQLWDKQQPELDNQGLRRAWQIECKVIRTLHRMWVRGVRIDEERLAQVERMIGRGVEQAQKALPEGLNDRSNPQLEKFFRDNGIKEFPMTQPTKKFPSGQPSFTASWLQTTELGRKIIAVRQLRNLQNSFIVPLRERHIYNGRVHANFNQTMGEEFGTVTGRLSCNAPNLQQVPKRNAELGPVFRSMFIPDPGMTWASCDYSQCEPRLLAHYGEVRILKEGYLANPPIDAHSAVAQAAGIGREPGKRMNQALLTGAGQRRLMELLAEYGAKPSEAQHIMDNYFKSMPEIKPFQKKAAAVYRINGFVTSLLGRRIHIDDPNYDYKAVNRLLQCGNADVNKKALCEVDEYYESGGDVTHILNDVHDDICNQFRPENRAQLQHAVEIMEDFGPGKTVHVDVPLTVDVGEGKNWAEASYGVDKVKKAFAALGEEYRV